MWNVLMHQSKDGLVPTKQFISSVSNVKLKSKILRQIDLLIEFGNKLREPHTKSLTDKRGNMYELRVHQSTNIARVFFFFFKGNKIILLNGFIKKDNSTPKKEIDKAYKLKQEYLEGK
jgi:phage-related protein